MRLRIATMLTLVALMTLLMPLCIQARVISYQAVLYDSTGGTQQAIVPMQFLIYDTPAKDGAGISMLLWQESHPAVDVGSDGAFSVELGSIIPFPEDLFDGQTYLEIVVNGQTITPRMKIGSSPHAHTSGRIKGDVESFPGGMLLKDPVSQAPKLTLSSSGGVVAVDKAVPENLYSIVDSLGNTRAALSSTGLVLTQGAAAGRVLTSDAFGRGTWQVYTGGSECWDCPGNYTILGDINDSVGIGTATPFAKLDVAGQIRASNSGSNTPQLFGITGTANNSSATGDLSAGIWGEGYADSPGEAYGVLGRAENSGSGMVYGGLFDNFTDGSGQHVGVRGNGWASSNALTAGVIGYGSNAGSGMATGGYFTADVVGTGNKYALYAIAPTTGSGMKYGIYAYCPVGAGNWAGYFSGDVNVTGTLSKGAGAFRIDHPLDPENKYLQHSFVESPDMKNIYDGVVTTDEQGFVTVTLPDWFSALNRDFRYQLTVIGGFAQAVIAEKIRDSQFVIRTDKPNVEVSWQVTGIRQDAFANANRIQVELDKNPQERGLYLHPSAFKMSATMGIDYQQASVQKMTPPEKGGK